MWALFDTNVEIGAMALTSFIFHFPLFALLSTPTKYYCINFNEFC